jgi:hypothetical protein
MGEFTLPVPVSVAEDRNLSSLDGITIFVIDMAGYGCGRNESNSNVGNFLTWGESYKRPRRAGFGLAIFLPNIAIALNTQAVLPGIKILQLKVSRAIGSGIAALAQDSFLPDLHGGLSQGFTRIGFEHHTLDRALVGGVHYGVRSLLRGTCKQQEQGDQDGGHITNPRRVRWNYNT